MINFRSEGRRFERGRCLVPASWFYEFRGDKVPKEKWKFTKRGEDWFCFAGLWRSANDNGPEAFTLSRQRLLPSCYARCRKDRSGVSG